METHIQTVRNPSFLGRSPCNSQVHPFLLDCPERAELLLNAMKLIFQISLPYMECMGTTSYIHSLDRHCPHAMPTHQWHGSSSVLETVFTPKAPAVYILKEEHHHFLQIVLLRCINTNLELL